MRKRILVISLFVMFMLTGVAYAATEIVKVYVNGREVKSDVPAQVINGRTMVPLRAVSESLGAEVKWDEASKTVSITSSSGLSQQDWAKAVYCSSVNFSYNNMLQNLFLMENDTSFVVGRFDKRSNVSSGLTFNENLYDKTFDGCRQLFPYTGLETKIDSDMVDIQTKYKQLVMDYRDTREKANSYFSTGDNSTGLIFLDKARTLLNDCNGLKTKIAGYINSLYVEEYKTLVKYTPKS